MQVYNRNISVKHFNPAAAGWVGHTGVQNFSSFIQKTWTQHWQSGMLSVLHFTNDLQMSLVSYTFLFAYFCVKYGCGYHGDTAFLFCFFFGKHYAKMERESKGDSLSFSVKNTHTMQCISAFWTINTPLLLNCRVAPRVSAVS